MELTANHNIRQIVSVCTDFEKRTKLIKHLDQISQESAKVLIFVGTKRVADDITKYLRTDGWPALAIHGDKEQWVFIILSGSLNVLRLNRRERDWVLGEFKSGRSPILIATDVASRGLGVYSLLRQALRQSVVVPRVCYSLDPSRLRVRIRPGRRSL